MADSVVVDGGEIELSLQIAGGEIQLAHRIDGGEIGMFQPLLPPAYTGPLNITPGAEAQVLNTEGLVLPGNITVAPVPNDYGLITWDGQVITVS